MPSKTDAIIFAMDHEKKSYLGKRRVLVLKLGVATVLIVALIAVRYAWELYAVQLMVWGCGPLSWLPVGGGGQCVVAVRTTEAVTVLENRAAPRSPAWCSRKSTLQALGVGHKACAMVRPGPLGYPSAAGEGGGEEGRGGGLGLHKACAEWSYACRGGPNTTIWYHHFHKAGGSTFVRLAEANGASLHPWNANGNPLQGPGSEERVAFWTMSPHDQLKWLGAQVRLGAST